MPRFRTRPTSNATRKAIVNAGYSEYPPAHAERVGAAEAKRQRKAAKRVADAKNAFLKKIVISYDTGFVHAAPFRTVGGFGEIEFPTSLRSETMHIRGSLEGLPEMDGASLLRDVGGISPHVPPKLHIIGTGENGERLETVFELVEEPFSLSNDPGSIRGIYNDSEPF